MLTITNVHYEKQPMAYVGEGEVKITVSPSKLGMRTHHFTTHSLWYNLHSFSCSIGLLPNGSPQFVKDWYNFCQSCLLIIWAYKVENSDSSPIHGLTIHLHTTCSLCRKKQGSSEQKVTNGWCHLIHKVWVWQYTYILLAAFAERSKDPVNRKWQMADVISSTKWILKISVTDKLPQITDIANASI